MEVGLVPHHDYAILSEVTARWLPKPIPWKLSRKPELAPITYVLTVVHGAVFAEQ